MFLLCRFIPNASRQTLSLSCLLSWASWVPMTNPACQTCLFLPLSLQLSDPCNSMLSSQTQTLSTLSRTWSALVIATADLRLRPYIIYLLTSVLCRPYLTWCLLCLSTHMEGDTSPNTRMQRWTEWWPSLLPRLVLPGTFSGKLADWSSSDRGGRKTII